MRFKRRVDQSPAPAGVPDLLLHTLENLDGGGIL